MHPSSKNERLRVTLRQKGKPWTLTLEWEDRYGRAWIRAFKKSESKFELEAVNLIKGIKPQGKPWTPIHLR